MKINVKSAVIGVIFFLVGGVLATGMWIWRHKSQQIVTPETKVINISPIPTVTFLIDQAPSESVRGEIASMEGEIMWQSRSASEPAKLYIPTTVQQGETWVTGDDGKLEVKFGNLANITVKKNSEVEVVQTLPVDFVFNQTSGRATFESVAGTPVSVRSLNLLVTILSGEGTVTTDGRTHQITVVPSKNSLTITYNDANFVSQTLTVPPEKKFVFDSDHRKGSLKNSY